MNVRRTTSHSGKINRCVRHSIFSPLDTAATSAIDELHTISNNDQGQEVTWLFEQIQPDQTDTTLWRRIATVRSELAASAGKYRLARR
jgi:hypothetical protein